ncbi:MAG: hypothetical protein JXB62_02545 [Pirellulales bacterium]|nr:hypothetical protein [Pirellulales bacterium]
MQGEQTTTSVDVITGQCWYTGEVTTRGFRVADVLNDATVDTLTMRDTVTGLIGNGSASVRWNLLYLRKSGIFMVIPKGTHEAPIRRANNYVAKDRFGAMIALPGHLLSGIVHLPSRSTPLTLLEEGSTLSPFLALTEVTVHSSTHNLAASRLGVVLVQRRAIESVQLTAQRLPKREAAAAPAEEQPLRDIAAKW